MVSWWAPLPNVVLFAALLPQLYRITWYSGDFLHKLAGCPAECIAICSTYAPALSGYLVFVALSSTSSIGVVGICLTFCETAIGVLGICCTSCSTSAPAPGSSAGPAHRLRAQAWRPGPAPRPKPQAWRLGILTVGFLRAFLGFQCLPMGFSIFASGIHFRVGFSNGISPCPN